MPASTWISIGEVTWAGNGARGLGDATYIGGYVEAGNVGRSATISPYRTWAGAGSVFFGADTVLGPLYLAYGHSQGSTGSLYPVLGQTF